VCSGRVGSSCSTSDTCRVNLVTNGHGYVPLIVSTSRSFPHNDLPLVEQELSSLPEHMSSSPVFGGVRVARSLVVCVCFVDRCLSFFAIVLSVPLRLTDSDYPIGIFKPFFVITCIHISM
jgi:hypothetical protein